MSCEDFDYEPYYGPEQPNPAVGEIVTYHGSLTEHHGVYQVIGERDGRTVLQDEHGNTLTVSTGNRSITVVTDAVIGSMMTELMLEIAVYLAKASEEH